MKIFKKRIIAFAALCCVAIGSTAGCSDKNSSKKEPSVGDFPIEYVTNEKGAQIQAPLQVITPNADGNISFGEGVDLQAPDKTESKEPVTEYVVVTDSNNQPVTEIVPVTEANGQPVTEENGSQATTAVNVTTMITVEPTESDPNYVSDTKSKFIYWMDISKDENFLFEGKFIKLKFKIKDDAPDRDYPIAITSDLATNEGKSLNKLTKRLNGTIRVGGDIENHDVSGETGLTVFADRVSAKAGETVDYYLNIKNNPGMVGCIMWVSYDANAMEFTGYEAAGQFADIASRVTSGNRN